MELGGLSVFAFSPDRHTVVMLAENGKQTDLKLCDTATGNTKTLTGHADHVTVFEFSPDGRVIVSGSMDNTVRLWDAETGDCKRTLVGHSDHVLAVAFSLDGLTLASGGEDTIVHIWDVQTEQMYKASGHVDCVTSVTFSPDGRTIASGSKDKTVRLWNVTGECTTILPDHAHTVVTLAFSPNARTLACGDGRIVRLWDTTTSVCARTLHQLSLTGPTLRTLAFTRDGRLFASFGDDSSVQLWKTGMASIDAYGSMQLWETGAGMMTFIGRHPIYDDRRLRHSFDPMNVIIALLSAGPSTSFAPRYAITSGSWQRLWGATAIRNANTLTGHILAFSPDGGTIASGSKEGTVRLWNATGSCTATLHGHSGAVNSVHFSPVGRMVASGSSDTTIRLWDATSGTHIRTLGGHSHSVRSVQFSPDGRTIVSGCKDTLVRLWNIVTGDCIRTLAGHSSDVTSVAFSPEGRTIASGSWDSTVRLWNAVKGESFGECVRILNGYYSVASVAFSPNGRLIASGCSDDSVRLWELTGESTRIPVGHHVNSVAFSPDGSTIATGGTDNAVRLWHAPTGLCTSILIGHTLEVVSVAFSPDGRTLASGSWDKTVQLCEVTPDMLVCRPGLPTVYLSVSPDGNQTKNETENKLVAERTVASTDEDKPGMSRVKNEPMEPIRAELPGNESVTATLSLEFALANREVAAQTTNNTRTTNKTQPICEAQPTGDDIVQMQFAASDMTRISNAEHVIHAVADDDSSTFMTPSHPSVHLRTHTDAISIKCMGPSVNQETLEDETLDDKTLEDETLDDKTLEDETLENEMEDETLELETLERDIDDEIPQHGLIQSGIYQELQTDETSQRAAAAAFDHLCMLGMRANIAHRLVPAVNDDDVPLKVAMAFVRETCAEARRSYSETGGKAKGPLHTTDSEFWNSDIFALRALGDVVSLDTHSWLVRACEPGHDAPESAYWAYALSVLRKQYADSSNAVDVGDGAPLCTASSIVWGEYNANVMPRVGIVRLTDGAELSKTRENIKSIIRAIRNRVGDNAYLLYHGTTTEHVASIIDEVQRLTNDPHDFGRGASFYLAQDLEVAMGRATHYENSTFAAAIIVFAMKREQVDTFRQSMWIVNENEWISYVQASRRYPTVKPHRDSTEYELLSKGAKASVVQGPIYLPKGKLEGGSDRIRLDVGPRANLKAKKLTDHPEAFQIALKSDAACELFDSLEKVVIVFRRP